MGAAHGVIPPLSIGEIVDRAVTAAVRRWRTLCVLALAEALPIGIARALLPDTFTVYGVSWACDFLLTVLLYPAAIFVVIEPVAHRSGAVLKTAARRYGWSLATISLSYLWFFLWLIVPLTVFAVASPATLARSMFGLTAPTVLAGIVALAVLPPPILIAAVMLPIAMIENTSPGDALARARRRVRHIGFRRAWLLGMVIVLITVAPVAIAGNALDELVSLTHLTALRVLDEILDDVVSLGFGVVLSTVAALEMRARSEGADLEAQLETRIAPADPGQQPSA